MRDTLADWAYLWEKGRQEYALLRTRLDCDDPLEGCLIFNLRDRSKVIIEDDALGRAIMDRMRDAGIPILTREQLPSMQNVVERMIDDMLKSGKSPHEINEAVKVMADSARGLKQGRS